jgi:hypothetical protein
VVLIKSSPVFVDSLWEIFTPALFSVPLDQLFLILLCC